MFKPYKKDQGRLVRMAAFWTVTLLLLFGCTFLHSTLSGRWESMSTALYASNSGKIPIVGMKVNGALLVSSVVFAVGLVFILRAQQRPKVADLLIDTEAELRKVTWPALQEVVDSSIVVIVCVVFLMGFLAGTDWFLGRVFSFLLLGG